MQANRDQNRVTTLLGTSNADGITPITIYADPVTHRLLVDSAVGSGTVTTVSIVTANGFAGTVANPTTTPAITLSTTITGLLKGNGTAISAATAGTDYQAPITLTTTGTSGNATFTSNTLNIPNYTYTLPTASTSILGGVKVDGTTITISGGVISAVGGGGGITFGSADQIPYTNITTDDFDYTTGFTFNGSDLAIPGDTASTTFTAGSAFVPDTNDGATIGTASLQFSDEYLATGGVINWANGNATLTHSTGLITSNVRIDAPTLSVSSATAPASVPGLYSPNMGTLGLAVSGGGEIELTSTAFHPIVNDGNALGTTTASWADLFLATGGVINWANGDVTVTHSSNTLVFAGASAGYTFDATTSPSTNDGAPLGSTSLAWSDLFLASGALVNFASGNVVLTHTTGVLTVTTGDLRMGTAGTNTASVTTNGGIQTMTNKRMEPRTASSTSATTLTPDLSSANVYYRTTQTATLTINAPVGTPVIGEVITIYVDSAGAQTLTIDATYVVFGTAFPAATTAGKTFMLQAQYNGTNWKSTWANAI